MNKAVLQTLSKSNVATLPIDITRRSHNIQIPRAELQTEHTKQTKDFLNIHDQLTSLKLTQYRFDTRIETPHVPIRENRTRILSAHIRKPEKIDS